MGRNSLYTEELADVILERMSAGESLRAICKGEGMPSEAAVRRWAVEDEPEGFAARYARACNDRAEHLAEEILEIADDGTGDTYVDDGGEVRVNHDVVQRSKLRVDARRWLLSKMLPRKYGDAARFEHSGPDGVPLKMVVEFVDPPNADE